MADGTGLLLRITITVALSNVLGDYNVEKDRIYLITVHDSEGRRIGMRLQVESEDAVSLAKSYAQAFGKGYTYKVWECKEVESK